MTKYHGAVGYVMNVEEEPGVWIEKAIERPYYGDIIKRRITVQQHGSINMNTSLSTEISIIADPFATQNFDMIRYVVYLGKKWTVTAYDVEYPRLKLTLGGIYNG